jgi:hypothetical protein
MEETISDYKLCSVLWRGILNKVNFTKLQIFFNTVLHTFYIKREERVVPQHTQVRRTQRGHTHPIIHTLAI